MASFTKTAGGWRAQISIKGVRDSRTWSTKAQATAWASERETELRSQATTGIVAGKTFEDACRRYELEVSKSKRGYRWEALRLAAMVDVRFDSERLGDVLLIDLSADVVGRWRDTRLATISKSTGKPVSGSTVNREMNLLSHVLSTARKEWGWIASSPTTDVRRPKESAARDRRVSDDEIERLCLTCGFDEQPVQTKNQAVAVAFLFAIETAMRAGEICGLLTNHIDGQVAHLPMTKNGTKRDVPLSKRAVQLLSFLPEPENPLDPIFTLGSDSLSTLFRKARMRCLIDDLTFHDSRHEAITRLAKKLNVLDLARMVGHRDLRQLQVYYNESAADMAARLD
ncbi:site-specific integrase [Undibacterium sp. RTI2.1]|uniref:tyrosine-type recombinase/integrase n=1 Tax=unclassified Undibacterium TaxID=2630295 RepID=UPI002B233E79|nr:MULTISPECIES: site-specific integrase [unclassified Undibacterium]MEB0029246.1 site-specific integrase [Undibacterium sp. RTI2.1]MEB0115554.1 site-specific integrase [Undibacterium sp. RTI2.2]